MTPAATGGLLLANPRSGPRPTPGAELRKAFPAPGAAQAAVSWAVRVSTSVAGASQVNPRHT